MEWHKYTDFTRQNAVYPGALDQNQTEMAYLALGIAGESGEFVDVIKKVVRMDYKHIDELPQEVRDQLCSEMGDIFWYLTRMLDCLDMPIEMVLEANRIKLTERYKIGGVKDFNHDE